MPKASKFVKTERLPASSRQVPYPNMQVPLDRLEIAVRPAVANQQRIMPRPPIQPSPSASPAATPRPRAEMWTFISGILVTNEFGNPLRTPEDVARILYKFIVEPFKKMMPHVDDDSERSARKLSAQRAELVIDWVLMMSATWPYIDAVQPVRLNYLVGLFLRSGCIKREVLGRSIYKTLLGFQRGNRMDYAHKLAGFVMQIHKVNWKLLGIRNGSFWPGTPDELPDWVNLLLPHKDNSPEAQAQRERPWTDGKGLVNRVVSVLRNPHGNPFRDPAPTGATNPPTMQRPMPAPAPAPTPRQPHAQQPQHGPSQKPRMKTGARPRRQQLSRNLADI
ncbi:hypothetical protein PG997_013069 [Apiospora hydei]|uniref:Uncharacterized protein n=1 Tax=Apiospora hydei TaxID=1337664 RepID=A0ABR1V5Y6_9PEZI